MKVTIVAGARPNFMKISPIIEEIKNQKNASNLSYRLVHTGQHYDKKMSDDFFVQLGIPQPDINLNAGGGTQAEQTAAIMIGFEKELEKNTPDLVLVVGDVTSTMACAIVAKKYNIAVAHVEAGIRSGDMGMPEEVNRIVTDAITDYFFTTTRTAIDNLLKNGISPNKIFFVGNTMVDTLLKYISEFKEPEIWKKAGLQKGKFFVLTLHRPSNVDNQDQLFELLNRINFLSSGWPVIFPAHPRTAQKMVGYNMNFPNITVTDPLSYFDFNYLVKNTKAVITDSGGITEEATMMGIPCMTMRNSTERPETCIVGTNELLGTNAGALVPAFEKLLSGNWKKGGIPELWDGKAAERIVKILGELKPEKYSEFNSKSSTEHFAQTSFSGAAIIGVV